MAIVTTPLAIVQAGKETTPGTAVAATRVVDMEPGSATLVVDSEPIIVNRAGSFASGHSVWAGGYEARVDFKNLPMSYDDLPWFMNHLGTPVASGTGSGTAKTWTQTPSDTADDSWRSTLEMGGRDSWVNEFKLAGCRATTISVSIKRQDVWRADFTMAGTILTKASKTAAQSARTVNHIVGAGTKVYLDSTSAFGTTQITGRLVSADVMIGAGATVRSAVDGTATDPLSPTEVVLTETRAVSAKAVLAFTSIAEYDAWRAGTAQRVQLVQTGASISGGGNYSATLSLGGAWKTWKLGDANGVITVELELSGLFDSSISSDWKTVTINTLGSLA